MRAAFAAAFLAAGAAQGATHVVTIEGMKYEPATLVVRAGDTVTWHNKDMVPHTATAAGRFDSRNIAPGQSWSWQAGAPGEHAYVCTYHLGMAGKVVVR